METVCTNKRNTAARLIPALLLLLAVAPACRAFFGVDWTDESYYAALAYRFCLGDQLFVHSWDIHQLSALFYAPLVSLYMRLAGGTEGLMLFLRLSFVLWQYVTSLFLFFSLRRQASAAAAGLVSAMALLFSHFAMSAFSYNTLALGFLFWTFGLLVRAESGAKPSAALFFAGLCYAFAVQSYPQLVLTCPLPLLYCAWTDKENRAAGGKRRGTLAFLLGIAAALALFCGAVCINSSFGALMENLPYLLSDPEHPMGGYAKKFGNYLHVLYVIFCPEAIAVLLLTPAAAICTKRGLFDKRPKLRPAFFAALLAAGLAGLVCALSYDTELSVRMNFLAMPLGFLYPALYLCSEERSKAPLLLFCIGAVYSVAVHLLSSNMLIRASSYPLLLCSTAAVLQADAFLRRRSETRRTVRMLRAAALCLGVLAVCAMGVLRVLGVHRDGALSSLDTLLAKGPAKGIRTTADSAARYGDLADGLAAYAPSQGNILITMESPLGYLFTSLHPAAPSVWRTRTDSTRLLQYYALHPEREPDVIAIGDEEGQHAVYPASLFAALSGGDDFSVYDSGYYLLYIKND